MDEWIVSESIVWFQKNHGAERALSRDGYGNGVERTGAGSLKQNCALPGRLNFLSA